AGHQFGHFTMLGDGRAILIGELLKPSGDRFDLQLKGSGPTPYSRNGDGRATLASMLREYLISEAMHHLGIPTTRSLAVVKTGENVIREMSNEGGVLTRIASSHIRVGTFEYIKKFGNKDELKSFTEYVINRHYPELMESENPALELLQTVMNKQVDLIVNWMRVGFIHGVMNTDNMSIAGETIDYGPCAFMNSYHPLTVFSSIDRQGRYAFQNQPYIANWNLAVFGSTLLPLIDQDQNKAIEKAQNLLDGMKDIYFQRYNRMMCDKLGIYEPDEADMKLVEELLSWMQKHQADYTETFLQIENTSDEKQDIYNGPEFNEWQAKWKEVIDRPVNRKKYRSLMLKNNPLVIPRNHLVEGVLSSAVYGNFEPFNNLVERLKAPYTPSEDDQIRQTVPAGFDQSYQTFCGT
ncbi:MAG: YdiU family protein, partial [Bacteroidota bacterium]